MSSETLIFADLHLREQATEITRRLLSLESRLRAADAIYLLGDFVEVWVGDDAPIQPNIRPAFDLLQRLSAAGIPVYFQHGNRDFLVGKRLAQRFGMHLLPEEAVIPLYGHRVALVHGDQLCTDDLAYQHLRRKLRHPIIQFVLRNLPLRTRQRLADGLRARSRMETGQKTAGIMDVNKGAVAELMHRLNVNVLIHGHTHRPAIHNEVHGLRAVLGDWEDGAVLLSVTAAGLRLEQADDRQTISLLAEADWPADTSL